MARHRRQATTHTGQKISQIVWRIGIYIRLSREDGNVESESVVNQKKILKEYFENYFEGEYVIVDYYVDDGLTGTDDTRADFMRMIHDIEEGKVNCVICKTLSRAFRNYSDQGYYLEYFFPRKNVRFISTGDPKIDTYLNPEAITGLEVPITGLMNDRYACRTSNDIRRTFNTKRRNGEYIGASPPYGFLRDPQNKNHLILDEETAPIKRDMLNWILNDGMSWNGVAHRLNALGIPSPAAYKRSKGWKYHTPQSKHIDGLWGSASVKQVLLNKMNLGHMVQGKRRVVSYKVHDVINVPEEEWFVVENTHEPTFTQEEYDALARILQRDTRTPNGEQKVYLFSGFVRCKDCGKAMHRRIAKGIQYYACRTYTEKSKAKCTKHSIRLDDLEKAVLSAIQSQIMLIESFAEMVDEINNAPTVNARSKRIEQLLKEKRRELERIQAISDGLYMDWKSGDITQNDYRRMKSKIEEQIAYNTNAIENLEQEQRSMESGVKSDDKVFADLLRYRNIHTLDRRILVEMVDKIYVHEDKTITIHFLHQDEYARILEFVELNTPAPKTA